MVCIPLKEYVMMRMIDVDNMSLESIEKEIDVVEKKPMGKRTVADVEYLDQLRRASRRIRQLSRSRWW